MAANNNSEFYKELDGYRHRSGCSGFVWWLVIILIIAGLTVWYLHAKGTV
jgi:hypothetical protein